MDELTGLPPAELSAKLDQIERDYGSHGLAWVARNLPSLIALAASSSPSATTSRPSSTRRRSCARRRRNWPPPTDFLMKLGRKREPEYAPPSLSGVPRAKGR